MGMSSLSTLAIVIAVVVLRVATHHRLAGARNGGGRASGHGYNERCEMFPRDLTAGLFSFVVARPFEVAYEQPRQRLYLGALLGRTA